MKLTNARLIVFSIAFLLGVLFVFFSKGKVVPIFVDEYAEEYGQRCSH
jgi:hypothetical protein